MIKKLKFQNLELGVGGAKYGPNHIRPFLTESHIQDQICIETITESACMRLNCDLLATLFLTSIGNVFKMVARSTTFMCDSVTMLKLFFSDHKT